MLTNSVKVETPLSWLSPEKWSGVSWALGVTPETIFELINTWDRLSRGVKGVEIWESCWLTKAQLQRAHGMWLNNSDIMSLEWYLGRVYRLRELIDDTYNPREKSSSWRLNYVIEAVWVQWIVDVHNIEKYTSHLPILRELSDFIIKIGKGDRLDELRIAQEKFDDLSDFLNRVFSWENTTDGIPYSLPLLTCSSQYGTNWYKLILWMLHAWHILGKSHPLFWRIPTNTDTLQYTLWEQVPIWQYYGSVIYKRQLSVRYPILFRDSSTKNTWHLWVTTLDISLQKVWEDPMTTFYTVWLESLLKDEVSRGDILRLKYAYILLWSELKWIESNLLAPKLLRAFIEENIEYFSDWKNIPPWHAGIKVLQSVLDARKSINISGVSEKSPKKIRKLSETPLQSSQTKVAQLPKVVEKQAEDVSQILRVPYSSPIIREPILKDALCMRTQERNTDTISLSVSSFCDTIPEGAFLCIKEGINNWRPEKYRADHTVIFDLVPPGKVRDMLFCFVSENETPSKNLKCTWIHISRPKERKERSEIQGIGNDVPQAVVSVLSIPTPPVWEVQPNKQIQDSPTDTFVLGIIESIESIEISRETQNILRINFPSGEGSFLKYDIKSEKFLEGILPEWVDFFELISVTESELPEKVQSFLSWELQHLCRWAIALEERQSRILLSRFPDFGSRDELLSECRLNWYASWTALLSKSSIWHLQSLQSEFSQVGISISLERMEKEMRTSIWLKSLWKQITIFSQNSTPYFSLENEWLLSKDENELAINIFLLVNILWKLLVDPPKIQKKNNKSRGNPDTQILSPEQIRDIIEWRYMPKTLSIDSLSRDEIDRLKAAIRRFDEWRWRILFSWGYDHALGFYKCKIEEGKSWNDISESDSIVLIDEKVSSVPGWNKWQSYIYDILYSNVDLQEDIVLRMIATIKSSHFRGRASFSNWLEIYFREFWEVIPTSAKEDFMNQVATESWKARNGLSFTYQVNGQDIVLFQSFLDGIRERKIPLIYSRPQIISFGELQEYRKTLQNLSVKWIDDLEGV